MLKVLVGMALALFALRGLYLLGDGIRNLRRARSSTAWPTTEGVVIRTEDARNDKVFSTHAIVRYQAGGKEYTTDLITFGETLNPFDRTQAGLLRVRYPDTGKVSVSYDPGRPSTAVLRPGWHAEIFWPLGFFCVVVAGGDHSSRSISRRRSVSHPSASTLAANVSGAL